jgi:hypothetical protein
MRRGQAMVAFWPGATKLLEGQFTLPTVKQHLAALRMLFDWLVTRRRKQIVVGALVLARHQIEVRNRA